MDRRSFTRPLSHLLLWIGELGLDRWVGIGWWWVWNGGFVDRWVDWLGWSLIAPMVASVMIFFEWVCSGEFQISWVSNWRHGLMGFWYRGCGCWWVEVLMGFWCRGCGCWWVDRCWWVSGAVAMVVDGLIGNVGFWSMAWVD